MKRSFAPEIRRLLKEHGPMTAREINGFFPDVARDRISSILSRMNNAQNEIHVKRWVRDDHGGDVQFYPRPVYALGSGTNAPKPRRLTQSEYNRRARRKRAVPGVKKIRELSSVFGYAFAMSRYAP